MTYTAQNPPFSKDYVLSVTRQHMLKSIQMSIDKTLARMAVFNSENDSTKSLEAFETLTELQGMKNALIKK